MPYLSNTNISKHFLARNLVKKGDEELSLHGKYTLKGYKSFHLPRGYEKQVGFCAYMWLNNDK